jgi:hypothetical protein
MTLPRSYGTDWLPHPYYWCKKHGPQDSEDISPKIRIHFDAVKCFRNGSASDKRLINRKIKEALGIPKRARITKQFAREFFKELESS